MISPVNTLLMLWLVITGIMVMMWLLHRRSATNGDADAGHVVGPAAVSDATAKRLQSAEIVDHVPHPALVGSVTGAQNKTNQENTVIDTLIEQDGGETAPMTKAMGLQADALATVSVITLTDMLEGLTLPYDLAPVTSVVEDPDRHMIFLTTHSNAGEVGKRFADELEQLGFEFEPVEYDHAVVIRGDDVISLKIVPDADRVDPGNGPRYGAAGPGDVALELWIGRSPAPPVAPK